MDDRQGCGVGQRLLIDLAALAERLGYERLHGLVLPENRRVLRLLQRVFPGAVRSWDDGVVRVDCPLGTTEITDADLVAALVSRGG